jgi:hypothetical protein
MATISAASRTVTNLPTSLRGPGVFASASGGSFWVREIGVFNTTTTAFAVGVLVCSATGTQVGGLTEVNLDDFTAGAADETAFTSQSSDSTSVGLIRQASVGAAIGAGVIFTFAGRGLHIPEGTGNGIILNLPTGTAQHFDFYIDWDK